MFDFFRELKKQTAVAAVITILLGLLLIILQSWTLAALLSFFGWTMIVIGAVAVLFVVVNRDVSLDFGLVAMGIVQLLAGLWVVRHPHGTIKLLAAAIGILVLIHALRDLQYAFDAYRANAQNWWVAAVTGGITLLLGVLILVRPFSLINKMMIFAGVCLIIDGISDLVVVRRLDNF
ncbi:MAG: DUF308 domain-containing protein [Oscillospiraceae bacterium]|nr:DUF308 domain-containing protein [Oscillospiraceae bacterium]